MSDNVSNLDGFYYLNTFDDILASGGKMNCWFRTCGGWFWIVL